MTDATQNEIRLETGLALLNPHRAEMGDVSSIPPSDDDVFKVHGAMPGYESTPLRSMRVLARRLGIRQVHLKDESKRFGLNAFKVLGATYAVYRELKTIWSEQRDEEFTPSIMLDASRHDSLRDITFYAATAGNHGRGLAWVARQCGLRAVIFVPAGTSSSRIEPIQGEGADVIEVDGDYDASVKRADEESKTNGGRLIADFGTPGYSTIPNWIESGYETMFREIAMQLAASGESGIDVVVLPGGGGCFSAGGVRAIRHHWSPQPIIVVVEPVETPSFITSARMTSGELSIAEGSHRTICSCLNCPTPSLSSWPTLRAGVDAFVAVDDTTVERAMRTLAKPEGDDGVVVSGPAGAASLAGLTFLMQEQALSPLCSTLGVDGTSRVLIINTEGDTDPDLYRRIVGDPR